jgi:uncharacterized membrane protein
VIFSVRRDWPALALLVAMFVAVAVAWPHVPERVPVHWGLTGEPDRWGGRVEGLLMFPLLTTLVFGLMVLFPRFDPGRANYAQFTGAYTVLRTALVAFFAVFEGAILASYLGVPVSVGTVAPALTGVLFILLGGMMGKVRPNWFVGIRTPWTLTSKRAWTRTHRVGGFAMIALGALLLAASAISSTAAGVTLLGGSILLTIGVFAYSYVVWRDDPDRQAPGGTTPG